ncbi:MAG: sugar phosphate nucleotidyltransferase [Steroidobacteraceae bacterium]|jgi:mannose-1-phosphate guanylyltransferase
MKHRQVVWGLVLAGGDGSRLHSLTLNGQGVAVPKQYCSWQGGTSLLADALNRAAAVAPRERLCAVVAAQHRQWWAEGILDGIPDSNVFVQPRNRGTAHGILLPLVKISARDPHAIVVLLPADHLVRDEETIAASLRRAAVLAAEHSNAVHLLGVQPDAPDPGLGYIVPSLSARQRSRRIGRFIEKPTTGQARRLVELGALWNTFIIAASARTLLTLYGSAFDPTIAAMRSANWAEIDKLYHSLADIDFSRDILEGNEAKLRVLTVPRCGWTDLGTLDRIALLVRRFKDERTVAGALSDAASGAPSEASLMGQYLHRQADFEELRG